MTKGGARAPSPTPHINDNMETATILLRRWRETDAEALYKYASDPDVGPRAGWPAHRSVEESLEIIRSVFANDSTWAIVLRETGEAIGCIGYYTHAMSNIDIGTHDCEVGYWLGRPYWNRGICTEDALRQHLCRPLHGQSGVGEGYGEVWICRHGPPQPMQPTAGRRQPDGQGVPIQPRGTTGRGQHGLQTYKLIRDETQPHTPCSRNL